MAVAIFAGMPLFLAVAVFGNVGVSLFVAPAVFSDVAVHFWEIAGTRNAMSFHTKCVSGDASTVSSDSSGCEMTSSWSDPVGSCSDRPRSRVDVSCFVLQIAIVFSFGSQPLLRAPQ